MADSLGDLLRQRGTQQEPQEFIIIRKYVQDRFEITPTLSMSKGRIVIGVPNMSIASNLRFELYELRQKIKTQTSLIIKISR